MLRTRSKTCRLYQRIHISTGGSTFETCMIEYFQLYVRQFCWKQIYKDVDFIKCMCTFYQSEEEDEIQKDPA